MALSWQKKLMARKFKSKNSGTPQRGCFEKIFLLLVFGGVAPIGFFLCGWWGSYLYAPETSIPFFTLGGLAIGLLLDGLFLRHWLGMAYHFNPIILIAIYLFYSIGMFGFFMGVPLFNALFGPLVGFYTGRRISVTNPPDRKAIIHRVSLFTAFVLAVACLAALLLAASEPTLAANIQGMILDMTGLNINMDNHTILVFSSIAGIGLVIAEFYLTRMAIKKAI